MPKRALILLGIAMALALFVINLKHITPAAAEQKERINMYENKKLVKSVVFAVGINKYWTEGKEVQMDARPFIESGRTFMPVRFLSNALGVENLHIGWDNALRRVTLTQPGFPVVEMAVGRIELKSNGSPVPGVDVAPVLRAQEGRTYLPARHVAEALGYEVEWDGATQTVLCWPKGGPKPDVEAIKQTIRKERDIASGKAPEGYYVTKKGYVVPKPENTKLKIVDAASGVDLTLVVYLPSSDYAKARLPKEQWRTEEQRIEQLKQVEEILAQKHGKEMARAVVEHAAKKTHRDMELSGNRVAKNGQSWQEFPLPGGGKIAVMSYKGDWYITIDVWRV